MVSGIQLGILGDPVSQSLSPSMHTHWLKQAELSGTYTAHHTKPDDLEQTLTKLQDKGYRGLNITIPHKVAVLPLLTQLDPVAKTIGAVNTIVFEPNGDRIGYNTDVSGFLTSLPEHVKKQWHLSQHPIIILGSGGVARAIVAGLTQLNMQHIIIAARNQSKATELIELAHQLNPTVMAQYALLERLPLHQPSGIINTLPSFVIQSHQSTLSDFFTRVPKTTYVYDVVYGHTQNQRTACCKQAQQNGLSHQDGLLMLIHQGAHSFKQWTDHTISSDQIKQTYQQLKTSVA